MKYTLEIEVAENKTTFAEEFFKAIYSSFIWDDRYCNISLFHDKKFLNLIHNLIHVFQK